MSQLTHRGRVVTLCKGSVLDHMYNVEGDTQYNHGRTQTDTESIRMSASLLLLGMREGPAAGEQTIHMVFAYRSVSARKSVTGKIQRTATHHVV